MRFLYPYCFLLFIPIALMAVYSWWRIYRIRKVLKLFGDSQLVKGLMPDLSLKRKVWKDIILLSALSFLLLAAARPQMGSKKEKVNRKGIEVFFVMDVSNSMLSTDVAPSRLDRAKSITTRMISQMENDRVGLIVFAGDAFVQLPITNDFISAKMLIDAVNPSLIANQGTAIDKALNLAIKSFSTATDMGRAIIVITDGENHDGDPSEALKVARQSGITVNVVGIGTPEGAPIPVGDGGYLTDENGQVVVSRLNADLAQEVAREGGGVYIQANDVLSTVRSLKSALDQIEKSEFEAVVFTAYDEKYAWFLWPGFLLLILDLVLLNRKNRWLRGVDLFNRAKKV